MQTRTNGKVLADKILSAAVALTMPLLVYGAPKDVGRSVIPQPSSDKAERGVRDVAIGVFGDLQTGGAISNLSNIKRPSNQSAMPSYR